MVDERQIQALIALLDDTDKEVFNHVAEKLFSIGPVVIDKLEDAYSNAPDPVMQERIENLIHQIQFDSIEKDLIQWLRHEEDDLLKGVLIITRHQYPEVDEERVTKQVQQIKKDVWQGINNYLSPLEQMHVLNQTLFAKYEFTGNNQQDTDFKPGYLNNVLDTSKGNHFSIGLLYLMLCQQVEIPVYGVCLSSHFILARTKDYITDFSQKEKLRNDVLFYINPYNKGLAFSDREINIYLKKLDIEPLEEYYLPASNKAVLKEYVRFLIRLYPLPKDEWKIKDLNKLLRIIEHHAPEQN